MEDDDAWSPKEETSLFMWTGFAHKTGVDEFGDLVLFLQQLRVELDPSIAAR